VIRAELPATTSARLGLLAGFWIFVGLFGGTSIWIGERVAGSSLSWSAAAVPALGAALLWIPITLAAVRLALRFPLRGDAWLVPLMVHGLAAGAVTFVLNFAFIAGDILVTGRDVDLAGGVAAAAAVGFRFLHINALVYAVIVGLTHWYVLRARDDRPNRAGEPAAAQPRYASRLKAGVAGRVTLIEVGDIRWIEADGDYARVHVEAGEHLVSERMKHLERQLDPARFVRIHRSRIVNVDHLRELRHISHGDYEVTLDDDTELRVSRGRRKQLLATVERSGGGRATGPSRDPADQAG